MAKKKKGTKKTSTHRRRMGAMALNAESPMLMIASGAAGYFLGDTINTALDKVLGTMDEKLKGGIEGGVGAALLLMKMGKKKTVLQTISGGVLAGAGAKRLLKAFGVITGYQSVPVIGNRMLAGYGSVPVVNGYNVPQALPSSRVAGVFNGYNVPPVPKQQVMGGMGNGSGLMNDDSGLMG